MRSVLAALAASVIVVTVSIPASAQDARPNVAYLELLGSGGAWSANYERAAGAFRLRLGLASWSAGDSFGAGTTAYWTVPLTISHVAGAGNHHLESGAGVTFGRSDFTSSFDADERSQFTTLTAILGYRYQKPGGRFVFRAVLTPLFGLGTEDAAYPEKGFFPSVGISVGRAF